MIDLRIMVLWSIGIIANSISDPPSPNQPVSATARGIHSSTQFASWKLTSISTPAWANCADSTPEQKSFHPLSSSAMLEPQRFVEEMPAISRDNRLASSTSSCSFPLSDIMLQFPITRLWRDLRLRVALKSSKVETLFAVPNLPPPIRNKCNVGLHLCIAGGGERWLFCVFFLAFRLF